MQSNGILEHIRVHVVNDLLEAVIVESDSDEQVKRGCEKLIELLVIKVLIALQEL